MDSIIFSAANLEVHVRETILQALPPEKTIFKEIVVLYSDPSKTKNASMHPKYTSWAEILNSHPKHPLTTEVLSCSLLNQIVPYSIAFFNFIDPLL